MLLNLCVKNIALIDEIDIAFSDGFTVLSGETGAGKSILVESIGLLTGSRITSEIIRSGEDEAVVEGTFAIDDRDLPDKIKKIGISREKDFIIKRRIGKKPSANKIYLNDDEIPLSMLKELSPFIIHILSQGQVSLISQENIQLNFLDEFGGIRDDCKSLETLFNEFQSAVRRLRNLQINEGERQKRQVELRRIISEIEKISPKEDEDESLQRRREILAHSEKIKQKIVIITESLSDEAGVVARLKGIESALTGLKDVEPLYGSYIKEMGELRNLLSDLKSFAENYFETLAISPGEFDDVLERINSIENLKRAYGPSLNDVLITLVSAKDELSDITGGPEILKEAEEMVEKSESSYFKAAELLSKKREVIAGEMAKAIEREVRLLAMEKARVELILEMLEKPQSTGIDRLSILFSANSGEPLRPLSKIASGGELSRTMLAVNSIINRTIASKTLVFDEIDSGISGRAAERVGECLRKVGKNHQVFCVTHLPQIAAHADNHYLCEKNMSKTKTRVVIKHLSRDERVREIARMMAGEKITETALGHAESLLKEYNDISHNG